LDFEMWALHSEMNVSLQLILKGYSLRGLNDCE